MEKLTDQELLAIAKEKLRDSVDTSCYWRGDTYIVLQVVKFPSTGINPYTGETRVWNPALEPNLVGETVQVGTPRDVDIIDI